MTNYLDHLLAVDEFTRRSPGGCVAGGYEMHVIARNAGLVAQGDEMAANWTGVCVELGYLTHGPPSAGDRRPATPGRMWTSSEVQRYNDYRVTATGREEADRLRRLAREKRTDVALGIGLPDISKSSLGESQQRAIVAPLEALRAALDLGNNSAAIGAAKDLVEAACKVRIDLAGQTFARGQSLPKLFKQAREVGGCEALGWEVANSLAATVQRLAELRNAVGAGHGHAVVPDVSEREALLAASAASGVAVFVLGLE